MVFADEFSSWLDVCDAMLDNDLVIQDEPVV
jgi:hypothetical protein